MRIVHVIPAIAPELGGPTQACLEMAGAAARLGHAVEIHSTDYGLQSGAGPAAPDGVDLHLHRWTQPRRFLRSPAMRRALDRTVPDTDVVHVHSLYLYPSWAAWRVCRRHGVPYILRPAGALDPYMWQRHRGRKRVAELLFQNRMNRDAACFHFTSEEERRLATPYCQGARGEVVPHGLDLAPFERLPPPGTFRARHPEIGDDPIVLFFGRLNFKKGLDVLVEAFAKVAARHPRAWLVIAGPDSDMGPQVRAWLTERQLLDRAVFTGTLLGRDKYAVLRDADVFVLPSYSENFGIAVVEAMAAGLPVVVSRHVNIWRELVAADAGWAGPVDADWVATTVAAALDAPDAARAKGARGRDFVAATYAWERVGEALIALYRDVAAGRPA